MTEEGVALSIYVLPSTPGYPPRALLMDEEGSASFPEQVTGAIAVWTADIGQWTVAGSPVPGDLGEAITEHAKSLGVSW